MKDKVFLEDIGVLHQFMRDFFKQCHQIENGNDMNKTQALVLVAVEKNQDNTMTKISEEVGLEKGSFTTVVDSLIGKGYLERVRSTKDRRKISLELTKEGAEVTTMIQQHMANHACRMFENMSEETLEEIKGAVHTLAEFARNFEG